MSRRSVKKFGVLLGTLLLAIIVGCQSVGGLNLNDMIMKQLDVSGQEQSQLFELELEFNDKLLSEEDAEVTALLNAMKKISLNISHSKTDDKGNLWMTGVFSFGKGDIPFTLHTDKKALRFDIGGAKRPFVLDISQLGSTLGLGSAFGSDSDNLEQALTDSARQLIKNVGAYFVKGLPNPPVISVDRISLPIHGVSTDLTKVHAEINGEQLGEWIPVYLDNLIKDKEGFRATLQGVLQWMKELPPEIKEAFGGEELLEEQFDSEAAIEEAVNELFPLMEEAQKELTEASKQEEWKEIFDKGITAKADLFVDDSLRLRKSSIEIIIAPAAFLDEESPVKSIRIRSDNEMWNVNGEIDIPAVQIPLNALTFDSLFGMEPFQVVRLFEEDSALYGILKNDFKADDQSFELSSEWGIPFIVDSDGIAFVPIRAIMEDFGGRLIVTSGKGEIRVHDPATGQAIDLHLGSAEAKVNEKPITLAHEVFADGPISYMSADDLLGILGAEYTIEELEDGELILKVTRDL
ncbi:stalk domain-containing protein [Cohnella herbarum]|uniref:Copper amine oxidase-like N-terminal domain-containing protein n=1 Tax=Cohnella herbarum TaxID=2728023 RepID=A0A7Z2VJF3_9BACL|nr:stalk domain-containing protein [Cohnella herbarum]QJD84162.1 hypothetical protein HH215_13820 [Cohnella herbarum]